MKKPHLVFLAQTQPGFEAIAGDEIERRLDGARIRGTRAVADKNGMLLFEYPGDVRDLFELRTIEDLFVVVATLEGPPPTREALRLLEAAAARTAAIEPALALARQVEPGRGGKGKLRFRVIARQVGRAAYRRVDAQQALARGLAQRSDHRWQVVEDGGLEFWLTLLPNEAIVALRLSDGRMRHREYKIEHLPASLRPASAATSARERWRWRAATSARATSRSSCASGTRASCRSTPARSARRP